MLTEELKNGLKQYLALLESDLEIFLSIDESENSKKLESFITEVTTLTNRITISKKSLKYIPSFEIFSKEKNTSVTFAGIPLGHEFESFVIALLQVSGRAPKISEELIKRIKSIDKNLNFESFVSLSCHNCPEVVQALNIMAILNPKISHTMIEGSMFENIVKEKAIMAVPSVFLNEEELFGGKKSIDDIVDLVIGEDDRKDLSDVGVFDSLVIGGGPSAMMASIYSVRKGIRTGLLSSEFGGQVKETLEINNILGLISTEGPKFMKQAKEHVLSYPVEIFEKYTATDIIRKDDLIHVTLDNGNVLKSKTVVLALGAKWRDLNVAGEKEFKNKGIAYCVHCDGPLFKDKTVVVVGGGNSGVESAIDLAGIAKKVIVLEFAPNLAADKILQDKLNSLSNVEVYTNALTKELIGDKTLSGIKFVDRVTNEEKTLEIEGCFIQIGLVPATKWLEGKVDLTPRGEIIIDEHGATNVEGIYAAGDATNIPYKQIIIAAGSGATASLGAYNYLLRKNK